MSFGCWQICSGRVRKHQTKLLISCFGKLSEIINWNFGFGLLEFICDLIFGAWNFLKLMIIG
jgi:hypothetical protein